MSAGNSPLMMIILLVIGALLGAVITYLVTGQNPENNNEEEEEDADLAAKPEIPGLEKAAVLYHNAEGRLVTKLNGLTFNSVKEMNPAAMETADALAREWFTWLGTQAPLQPTPAAVPTDDTALEELHLNTPAASKIAARPRLPIEEEDKKVPEAPKESMIEQIDNILQDMLAGSELDDRGIHLVEGANMGVIVWVGSQSYQGIDQVADPVIAKVIKKAVGEWERRSVPN